LVVQAGPYRCVFPLDCVVETMRPLPLQSFVNMPACVCGASIIHGEPVPVVDLARLLGTAGAMIGRFVVVHVDDRKVALAVDSVAGVEEMDEACLASVPPLLQAAHPEFVGELGAADRQLLVVLNGAWTLPDTAWEVSSE
jgi:purine-binding chemotaxis protein CheW